MGVQQILTAVMTNLFVDKRIDHAKPLSIHFLPQYRHQIKRFIQFVNITLFVDDSNVVCTLIENGKLANQIATLLLIVCKIMCDQQLNTRKYM